MDTSLTLPTSFSQSGSQELGEKWWLAFNDAQLNELIEQALDDNFALQSSWDRLSQAKALYQKNRVDFFPSLDAEASAGHSRSKIDDSTVQTDSLGLGLSAQYEVDLWGRIGSTADAAELDVDATAADLEAAAMTIAAEVAITWYQLVQQNSNIGLLDQQIATNRKGLELISAQFRTGQVPMADVLQQRQLIESQLSERVQLVAERKQSEHQISILLGEVPGTTVIDVPSELTALPPLPETGIPSQIIQARPDVRSSFHEVEAADKRIAAAVADQFPALRLTLSLETAGGSSGNLFSNYLASVASSLVGPILDGGQRRAEVARTRAVASEKLHNYGQIILQALAEVEDALIEEKQQLLYLASIQVQLDFATQTMRQIKDRYLKGVADYERVLSALTSMQSLEQNILAARKNLLVNRVDLCRALGRSWNYSESNEQLHPVVSQIVNSNYQQ